MYTQVQFMVVMAGGVRGEGPNEHETSEFIVGFSFNFRGKIANNLLIIVAGGLEGCDEGGEQCFDEGIVLIHELIFMVWRAQPLPHVYG